MHAALIATAHVTGQAATNVSSDTYNWLYVGVGVLMLVGLVYAGIRWLKKQAVAEAALQALVDANVLQRLKDQDEVLAEIRRAQQPNGLDTDEPGDIGKRTENLVKELFEEVKATNTKLDKHMGASEVEEREIWRAINGLRGKDEA